MIGRRRPHGSGTPPGSSVRHSPQRHGSREAGQGQRSHCSPPGQVDDTVTSSPGIGGRAVTEVGA
eukprot:1181241-Prorocentrum_minimum.AAC.2